MSRVVMCEVRSKKNGQEQKRKKKKKSTVVSSKKKSTMMSPIRRRMKKCNPSSGQNGQLVHWWLLTHSGRCFPTRRTRLLSCSSVLLSSLPHSFSSLVALYAAFCALHSRVFCSGIIPRWIETVDAELEGLHGVYSGDIRRQGVLKLRT